MRVSRRHWRHAESLFSAHARRRLDQRSRAHRSARHACRRSSRRGSWSVRRPRGQGAAEARAEGGRLVFYTPSHRPAPLATACTAASSPGGQNGALGASHQRRGRRRGSGRREAVDRAEAVGRARERPERPDRPEARAGRRLPIGRAPWTRRARHSRSAGQKRQNGTHTRQRGARRRQVGRWRAGRGAAGRGGGVTPSTVWWNPGGGRSREAHRSRRARSSSCAWGLNCGEFWGGLRRAAEATASC